MRALLLVAGIAGCATVPASQPQPPVAPMLDDQAATELARGFFDAVDRRDIAAFRAMLTPGFVLFEDGQAMPADRLAGHWEGSDKPPRTRTCANEAIHRSPAAVVYIGDCTEHQPAHADRPAEDWQGWNSVVLVPDGDEWKVALWQWQRSGVEGERVRWNDAFRRGTSFTKDPNRLLVDTVAGKDAGKALVLAMGQGRNALYLASRGWDVTGVDISDVGVFAARAAAAERGLTLAAVLADIGSYDFGVERWDLVTMLYAGGDPDWIARAQAALVPGGLFVLEHFYTAPEDAGGGIGFGPGELASAFAGWDIVKHEVVEDVADWGMQKARLIRFAARKP